MTRSMARFAAIALLAAAAWPSALATAKGPAEVPADEVKKIEEAIPKAAPAKPAKERKIFVFSHCNGYVHGPAIARGKIALELMGKQTGAYTTVISDDLSNFEPEKLKQFDLVVLNNTTGELFAKAKSPAKPREPNAGKIKDAAKLAEAQEKYKKDLAKYEEQMKGSEGGEPYGAKLHDNFMSWIKDGGAVFGIHAATDCSSGGNEYNEMIGGRFSGHPWTAETTVTVRNDDPTNPINAAFDGKGFKITEEIYRFNKGFYSRGKQRVLLSLDPADPVTKKGGRPDKDYAISWVKTWGKGRVFYCSLGHRNEIFWNPVVLKHYLAGIQWALGDLKGVETKPNPLPESEKPK